MKYKNLFSDIDFRATLIVSVPFLVLPLLFHDMFRDAYTVPKWLFLFTLAPLAFAATGMFCKKIELPRPSLTVVILAAAFALSLLVATGSGHLTTLTSFLVFIILTILFYNFGDLRKATQAILVAGMGVTSLAFFNALTAETHYLGAVHLSASFGNTNMCAQFLAFAVIAAIIELRQVESPTSKVATTVALGLMFCLLWWLQCRSVYIALGVALIYLAFTNTRRINFHLFAAAAIATASIVAFPTESQPIDENPMARESGLDVETYTSIPSSTPGYNVRLSNIRLRMWYDTLHLVKDNPFGVGPDQFGFNILPYQAKRNDIYSSERVIMKSPHNEFLRVASEYGIVALLSLGLLVTILLVKSLKRIGSRKETDPHRPFIICCLIILFFESTFQFPFQNSFPFLLVSALLAHLLRVFPPIDVSRKLFLTATVIAAICTDLSLRQWQSALAFGNDKTSIARQIQACNRLPDNWRLCTLAAYRSITSGDVKTARTILTNQLKANRHNFFAMNIWSRLAYRLGLEEESCNALTIYNSYFQKNSSARDDLFRYCPNHRLTLAEYEAMSRSQVAKTIGL